MNSVSSDDTIVHEITIHAPADRIFEALINSDQRLQWWGADGRFRATHMESDLRPGGRWAMRGVAMGGKPFTVVGEYREITRPRALVFTWLPDWEDGAPQSLVRIELREADGTTTVRLTHSGLARDRSRQSHRGWPQLLARLRAHAER